jgi:hypothetical protein
MKEIEGVQRWLHFYLECQLLLKTAKRIDAVKERN